MATPKHHSLLHRALLGLGLGLFLCLAAGFAEGTGENSYQVSSATSAELNKYKAAIEATNLGEGLAIIDAQLAKVEDRTSYDAALLNYYKALTHIQRNEFSKAIAPLETALSLSDAHTPNYFDTRLTQEFLYFLSQLYLQDATAIMTKDPKLADVYLAQSEKSIVRWLDNTLTPSVDILGLYASILYSRATVFDAEKPDAALLKRTIEVVDRILGLSTHPREQFYLMKLVCLQLTGRNQEAVDVLELLVFQNPKNQTYWQQLLGMYLNMGMQLQAVLTIERAQQLGFMNEPRDNMNLFSIHFNMSQYGRAAEILEKGLHDGSIENTTKNWELLATTYQQMKRDDLAIGTLKEAIKTYPESGQMDYLIAQIYFSLNRYPEALEHLKSALAKDGGTSPAQTNLFMAFMAFELKNYDLALEASERAMAFPEAAGKAASMRKAVEDVLAERAELMRKM